MTNPEVIREVSEAIQWLLQNRDASALTRRETELDFIRTIREHGEQFLKAIPGALLPVTTNSNEAR